MKLEAKTLDEMIEAKNTFATIIKENGLDVKTFSRLQTFSFTDSTDLFQEFDSFLEGRSVGNGFRSDSLQNYLFDLGANLLAKGYKEDIKQYLVSDEEYAKHYARINGQGSWAVTGNINGNFIFSTTYPERYHYVRTFDRKKNLVPWWSFIKLTQFKRAYDIVIKNEDLWSLFSDRSDEHNRIKIRDKLDVIHMAQDLENIIDQSSNSAVYRASNSHTIGASLKKIDKDELKGHVMIVHNRLLQEPILKIEIDQKAKNNNLGMLIESITFIEKKTLNKSAYSFYINQDTSDIRDLRRDSSRIRNLIKVVKNDESVPFSKDLLDYINSNSDCALYCAGKYKLTKILERHDESFRIHTDVEARVIGETAHKKELNRKKKA